MTTFKLKARRLGEHVHVRIFAGPLDQTLANLGEITFRPAEWEEFKRLMMYGDSANPIPAITIDEICDHGGCILDRGHAAPCQGF